VFQPLRALPARARSQISSGRSKRIAVMATASILSLGVVGAPRGSAATTTTPGGSSVVTRTYATPRIPDSAFTISAGAEYVSPSGSDANPGSIDAPFLTIGHAVAAARPGATIVVRAGTYRESLGSITKRVTIQAYPHEQVWMKGSVPVDGFVASGSVWVKEGWTDQLCHTCFPRAAIDPSYPAAGLPDQVFVDDQPQTQVLSSQQLVPGTFYVDTQHHELWLGSDPTGHTVEATYYPIAMQFNGAASGSQLLGIGVSEYGPEFDYRVPAMVVANTTNLTFENDAFDWSASRGLSVLRAGAVVERSSFLDNGANGLHANTADGLLVMYNRFAYSNYQHFSTAPSATASIAAVKITSSRNVVVKKNNVDDNNSTGVWLDINVYNATVVDNTVVRNAVMGIMYEISSRGLIAGNVVADNGKDGIRISGSTNTEIWNNTLSGNGGSQIGVYDDSRVQHDARFRKLGITWNTTNVRACNNVLADGPDTTGPLFDSFDASRPRHLTTLQMVSADRDNMFVRSGPTTTLASWQTTLRSTTQWPTLAALQAATGREQGSSTATDPGLGAVPQSSAGQFVLHTSGLALPLGAALPPGVAAAMGVSGPVHLGAPDPAP
jgi:parallel beta-helix repeat protein